MSLHDVDKVIKTPYKVLNWPIQMYQRKTVGHLPVGICFNRSIDDKSYCMAYELK